MTVCKIPQGYDPKYGIMDTERAIKRIKDFFETELSRALNLSRISAPLFVKNSTGLNDNLNGIERPISQTTQALDSAVFPLFFLCILCNETIKRV